MLLFDSSETLQHLNITNIYAFCANAKGQYDEPQLITLSVKFRMVLYWLSELFVSIYNKSLGHFADYFSC
jgi:hypothetical protein